MTHIALFSWPLVVLVLFRRYPPATAIALSIIGGYLLLPTLVGMRLPLLPDLDKNTLSALPALVLAMTLGQANDRYRLTMTSNSDTPTGWIPRHPMVLILLAAIVIGIVMTTLTNSQSVRYGPTVLRGVSPFDGASALMNTMVAMIPFFLARKFLARPEDHRTLVIILCLAGFLYSLLALYEIRMSPQLNKTIYGYFPHDWSQHRRGGGWRPIVFLHHGLWLGIFLAGAVLAAAATINLVPGKWRSRAIMMTAWLFVTLFLAKTLGAFLIVLVLLPFLFLSVRAQMLCAAGLCAAVLFYPMLRSSGLVPINQITNLASMINEQRALSFLTRLNHENALLEKASQRPLFGWSGYSRARVYSDRGEDLSVTDGFWIILLGEGGWMRYLGNFGLLAVPTIILAMRQKAYEVTLATSALCLILTANLIDLIPNATMTSLTWLIAGALAGRLEVVCSAAGQASTLTDTSDPERGAPQPSDLLGRPKAPVYSRQTELIKREPSVRRHRPERRV
ncbi:MAG: hypothetical protein ABJX32_04295 [Tateyamaria sp.]|uniref:hypothetical protein n=1 Tax=Alphaproteobacteria TaxID=28211 RepID=UPI00329A7930